MSFNSLAELRTHLIDQMGYQQADIDKWFSRFGPKDTESLLTIPLKSLIASFPVTALEETIRQSNIAISAAKYSQEEAEELWGPDPDAVEPF